MELWKIINLMPPPVLTTSLENKIDIVSLEHVCKSIVRVLSMQTPLHSESALLSRFMYKYDKKFRNDIGCRNMKKTLSTLRKYLQLNLLKDIEHFISYLPNEEDDFLPSRQMLEFILIRIITFSKLMLRVCVCSKQAAVFYFDRIKRGESHWMSLMPYALLSRLWSMSMVLLQRSTTWYTCLYNFHTQLQPKGKEFLPNDYKLPKDLDKWLELKNLDEFGKFEWSSKNKMHFSLSFHEDESDTFDNVLNYISQINDDEDFESPQETRDSFVPPELELTKKTIGSEDLGQAISRESFNILTDFQKKIVPQHKVSHYFGKVCNLSTLQEFIDKEETFRNNENSQCVTKHLSFMQWQTLKSALLKQCNELSNKRKIERKLQKVWKEKCLDYL